MGSTSRKGKGRFWGFLFSIFTMGNAIGSPTMKCFWFVCETITTFPFGKRIVGKLDSWAFWRYIRFQHQRRGLWEISKNGAIVLPKLKCKRQTAAARGPMTAAAAVDRQLSSATRPCPQITLGRLVNSWSIAVFTVSWLTWSQQFNRRHFR